MAASRSNLLAIDPAKHGWAWAYFEADALRQCGLHTGKYPFVTNLAADLFSGTDATPHHLIMEVPQVYHDNIKTDQNDLIALSVSAGIAIGSLGLPVRLVQPREWKGQVPKKVTQRRVARALSPVESEVLRGCGVRKGLLHNVYDAIAIGMWQIGRYR